MSGDFLDSNVILYAFEANDPRRATARDIIGSAVEGNARISFQIVQEVLNVLSRKTDPAMNDDDLERALQNVLVPLWRVQPSSLLYERALDIRSRYRYGFYDSLVIAAALESGCTRLLSEDLQHGQRIEGLTIENPFRDV